MKTTTQKPTLDGLVKSTNIPESLVRAVVQQMGGWKSFKESAPDICRGGIDGGFHGFIYYSETLSFAKRNRKEILEMASEHARNFGMGLVEMIQGFGCFRHSKPSETEIVEGLAGNTDETQVPNALAWYAGEEVARAYFDAFGSK
jgi:hypothetical protein